MSFLSWTAIAAAAGLTIPPLVALYFLKLKREVRPVPSTLLWKRAVEDLHVNAPFQRLRSGLLLILQLLILLLAALALGKPMFQTAQTHKSTIVLLIDQSASMGVVEEGGRTRLAIAKEQAKAFVDNMDEGARAMVIAFCDRATVVSAFDTDKVALQRKIDSIEQTQSTSALSEAISLAEAYTQNMVIGLKDQRDIEIAGETPPATVAIFSDGRIEDADRVALQKFEVEKMQVVRVGHRTDNVGILAMDARRNYERPEMLQAVASVQNFGPDPVTLDAVLHVDGRLVDVQTLELAGAGSVDGSTGEPAPPSARRTSRSGSIAAAGRDDRGLVVFDHIEFEGDGLVEVELRIDDALPADNRAWTIIARPGRTCVLLVTDGNLFLEDALAALPIETVRMTAAEYESTKDEVLLDGQRSAFDVVILDGHSTGRLPQGNYFFWGAVPQIDGVSLGNSIGNEVIFNWDDTHPILRYVAVETLRVYEWFALALPPESQTLIEGETSPVLAYLTRDASQFLICAFRLIVQDEQGFPSYNTYWGTTVDFLIFVQNAVNYLASNVATAGQTSVVPGQPVTLPVPAGAETVTVERPDKRADRVPTAGYQTIHYADTRVVGPYKLAPGLPGEDMFAVNLFNPVESNVAPAAEVTLGSESIAAQASTVQVNEPAWPYVLIALLAILLLEWVVYNRRVFV